MRYRVGLVFMMILLVSDLFAGQGRIRISCDREGAYIYVDGKKKAMTGSGFTKMFLDEGDHEIRVTKSIDEFYVYEAKKNIFVGEETSTDIHFELKRELTAKGRAKKANKIKHLKRVGNIVIDKKRNLMWQDDVSAKSVKRDWSGAKRYCQNLSLGGYSDWRLPDYYELVSIVDYDRYDPAIFSLFKNTASDYYWSSSVYVSYSSNAWGVQFSDGSTYYTSKTNKRYVRCVRVGQ